MKDCKAYADNVIVKLDKAEERKTEGGLYVSDSERNSPFGEKILTGSILSAGPGGLGTTVVAERLLQIRDGQRCVEQTGKTKFYPVDVVAGERVLFPQDAGEPVTVGVDVSPDMFPSLEAGTQLRILRESEIIGVIEA